MKTYIFTRVNRNDTNTETSPYSEKKKRRYNKPGMAQQQ